MSVTQLFSTPPGFVRKHATQIAPTSPKRLQGSPKGLDTALTKLSDEAGGGRVNVVASILDHVSDRTYGREAWLPPTSHHRGLNLSEPRKTEVQLLGFTFHALR